MIRPSLGQQADIAWRAALPVGLTLLLLFAALLSWHLPRLGTIASALVLISVFFWTLHQPGVMSMWGVLSIGLVHDLMTLAPFGVGLLVLLIVHGVALWQRKALNGMPFLLMNSIIAAMGQSMVIVKYSAMGLIAGAIAFFIVVLLPSPGERHSADMCRGRFHHSTRRQAPCA